MLLIYVTNFLSNTVSIFSLGDEILYKSEFLLFVVLSFECVCVCVFVYVCVCV